MQVMIAVYGDRAPPHDARQPRSPSVQARACPWHEQRGSLWTPTFPTGQARVLKAHGVAVTTLILRTLF
jgi:hypothetical protein